MTQATASTLAAHPWVAQVAVGHSGVLLQLNAEGVATLRRQGRQACIDALQRRLAEQAIQAPPSWRLCDRWPDLPNPAHIDILIGQPLPKHALLLADSTLHDESILQLLLPLELQYFSGHFPRLPVLPGVVQLAWALELAAERLGTPRQSRRMDMLKFQHLLRPGDELQLQLRHDRAAHKLHFAYRLGDRVASCGRFAWDPAEHD
ncbi:ApeI family dehydratase [Dyella sp. Tek66A03]|jgi:3-hydroxymyristoyl/3-hydroxydecanoyl-(acyl carrier protein) dehydratase|uniref:ApeI family dehydratase n=1 Tax=Dyella sp. Tek66A03 TaxID=3458298 RepID=UPI00403EC2D8